MGPVLNLDGVSFAYGETPVLDDVSVDLAAGEMLGIVGPNGSGKSTLLKLMDGLLKAAAGEIRVSGVSLEGLSRGPVSRRIAMVSQESHFAFPFSVLEVVLMGRFPYLGLFQYETQADMEVALQAMQATRCEDLASRAIQDLSGGERQRVLIARALAQEPQVMLLDEPTAFLDLRFKSEIFRLLRRLSQEKDLTIVVVSHDLDLVAQYCSRILMLNRGRVHALGEPAHVLTSDHVRAVYDCPVHVDTNPVTGSLRVNLL